MKIGGYRPFWMPFRIAVTFLALHCAAVSAVLLFSWSTDLKIDQPTIDSLRALEMKAFLAMVIFYGVYRVTRYFPVRSRPYATWLLATPWRPGRSLPLGPAYLTVQDVVPLLAVWWIGADPLLIFIAFAAGYAGLALVVTACRATAVIVYVCGLLVPTIALVWDSPAAVASLVAVVLGLTQLGLGKWLKTLPWSQMVNQVNVGKARARQSTDWLVAPATPPKSTSLAGGFLIAMIVGWWAFGGATVLFRENPDTDRATFIALTKLVTLSVALFRLVIYTGRYKPPINIWGRIFTLRFVIPGYDYVLLAPLVLVLLAIGTPVGLAHLKVSPPLLVGVTVFVVLLPAISLGPTLRSWQLTGHHRITVNLKAAAKRDARGETKDIVLFRS